MYFRAAKMVQRLEGLMTYQKIQDHMISLFPKIEPSRFRILCYLIFPQNLDHHDFNSTTAAYFTDKYFKTLKGNRRDIRRLYTVMNRSKVLLNIHIFGERLSLMSSTKMLLSWLLSTRHHNLQVSFLQVPRGAQLSKTDSILCNVLCKMYTVVSCDSEQRGIVNDVQSHYW